MAFQENATRATEIQTQNRWHALGATESGSSPTFENHLKKRSVGIKMAASGGLSPHRQSENTIPLREWRWRGGHANNEYEALHARCDPKCEQMREEGIISGFAGQTPTSPSLQWTTLNSPKYVASYEYLFSSVLSVGVGIPSITEKGLCFPFILPLESPSLSYPLCSPHLRSLPNSDSCFI